MSAGFSIFNGLAQGILFSEIIGFKLKHQCALQIVKSSNSTNKSEALSPLSRVAFHPSRRWYTQRQRNWTLCGQTLSWSSIHFLKTSKTHPPVIKHGGETPERNGSKWKFLVTWVFQQAMVDCRMVIFTNKSSRFAYYHLIWVRSFRFVYAIHIKIAGIYGCKSMRNAS